MRIAFLLNHFPGLSITFIIDQITGLLDRGHSVTIFAANRDQHPFAHPAVERYNLLGRTVYYQQPSPGMVATYKGGLMALLRSLMKAPVKTLRALDVFRYGRHAYSLRLLYAVDSLWSREIENTYDIVHCHMGPIGIKGALFRDLGLIQGRLVTTFHGYDVTQYPARFGPDVYRKYLFSRGDLFMTVSEHMRKRIIDLGCEPQKTIVHHVGIDTGLFDFKARSLVPGEQLRLVSVARLTEKKGLEYAIRAVADLAHQHNVSYRIVGDGELREKLEGIISGLDARGYVKLLGWRNREEVAQILKSAHLFLAPSVTAANRDEEGIPTSIMEAAATGLPVLSTSHSGIPELVLHERSGLVVPERDPDAIREGLILLIDWSERWGEMGMVGRQQVESEFNIETLNDALVETYGSLVRSGVADKGPDRQAVRNRREE